MNFEITILGTSSAFPMSRRFPSAQVVDVYGKPLLIDCGEGTQMQLRKFKVNFGKIKHIFISHLHGDHFFGLFGLISTYQLLHRNYDLEIFAPEELKKIFDSAPQLVDYSQLEFKLLFKDLPQEADIVLDSKNFTVTAFPLKHKIPTWGFVIREKQRPPNIIKEKIAELDLKIEEIVKLKQGQVIKRQSGETIKPEDVTMPSPPPRSYAYCSDTAFFPDIVKYVKNVDVLYHEATFSSSDEDKALKTMHSTARQAAIIAKEANVKLLVLGHFSAKIKDFDSLLAQAKEVFPNTVLAYDGMKIVIPFASVKKQINNVKPFIDELQE